MKRFLMVLGLVVILAQAVAAQQSTPTVALGALAGVGLTETQQDTVNTLYQARIAASALLETQMASTSSELETLLDAANPDLSRIGTLSRKVRTLAAQDKQLRIQFRRDVWQLLTVAQKDLLLARLGF